MATDRMLKSSPSHPLAIVVMGVCGSGKSTLARALARRLDYAFVEGDDVHPPANRAKMAASIPLNDEDRRPWLDALALMLAEGERNGGVIASCSALRRCYRDRLSGLTRPIFVHPVLDRATLEARLSSREGHFMPLALLDSQLATLEMPGPDENSVYSVDATLPTAVQVDRLIAAFDSSPASPA